MYVSSPDKLLRAKFAVGYALLGALALMGIAAFVISVATYTGKASKSSVAVIAKAVDPSKDAAVKSACNYAVSQAAASGLVAKSCALHKGKGTYQIKGDLAQVVVDVVTPDAKFVVAVSLSKGVWTAGGLQVITATPTKK